MLKVFLSVFLVEIKDKLTKISFKRDMDQYKKRGMNTISLT